MTAPLNPQSATPFYRTTGVDHRLTCSECNRHPEFIEAPGDEPDEVVRIYLCPRCDNR